MDNSPFATGLADAQGNFTISVSGFSEPSCVATLFEGSVSVEVTLSGCTPTKSRPPAVPGAPVAVAPPPRASVTEPVALSWQPPAGGAQNLSFRWQLSTSPSFARLALTATTSPRVTSTTLSGLAPGRYFWRVQAVSFPPEPFFPLFGNWTATRSLTITGSAPDTPGPPTCWRRRRAPRSTRRRRSPLTWTAVKHAVRYRPQMSRNPAFAPGPKLLVDVPEATTIAHAPLFGFQNPLFVRVFGVARDGSLGLPSPTVALNVTFQAPVPPAPGLLAPADGATVPPPVKLSWTPDPNPQVPGYQLEISKGPNFHGGCGGVE